MEIARANSVEQIVAASYLFDKPVDAAAADEFLMRKGHHLLLAYNDDGRAVGFISGIEMFHPDKGVEMFLYELAVDPEFQRRGAGVALVKGLSHVAKSLNCYDMWVLTDDANGAALATYKAAGASLEPNSRMLTWSFESPT